MAYNFSHLENYQHEGSKALIAYGDSFHPGWAVCKLENAKWGVYNLVAHTMRVLSLEDIDKAEITIRTKPIWRRNV